MEFLKQFITGLLLALAAVMIVLGAGVTTATESRLGEHNLISDPDDGEAACDAPDDWVAVQAQTGDTLASLAESAGIDVIELMQANCLQGDIHPQDVIYIPQVLREEPSEPCGPPQDWVFYQVKNGDDLLILAERFSITVSSIQRANCLESGELIGVGEYLYLPVSP